MAIEKYSYLTPEQRTHFLEHGWVRIPKAITPENIAKFSDDVWVRLGYDKDDMSTWKEEKIHMPRQREMLWKDFTPKAWGAICELLGGEERIDPTLFHKVGDSLIVNLGAEEWRDKTIAPRDLGNWHADGDWFTHFLDSGEQALVTLHIYNDIKPRAGATYICEDGLQHVIKWLYDRPEGRNVMQDPDGSKAADGVQQCNDFVELTGEAGDIILCHPFMVCAPILALAAVVTGPKSHTPLPKTICGYRGEVLPIWIEKQQGFERAHRFITNPPVVLKEPMNLNRENPDDYSLVEQKTLRELGVSALPDWKITGARERFTPRTRAGKNARIADELQRMKEHAAKTGGMVDSIHLNGITAYAGETERPMKVAQ